MPFEQANRFKSAITKQTTNPSSHLFSRCLLFVLLHEFPKQARDVAGSIDFCFFYRLARVFEFNSFKRTDLDPGYRVDADKRPTVFSGMMVGTFQQDRIPKTVTQAQVNPDRCIYIRQHFLTTGIDLYFPHGNKKPRNFGAQSIYAMNNDNLLTPAVV